MNFSITLISFSPPAVHICKKHPSGAAYLGSYVLHQATNVWPAEALRFLPTWCHQPCHLCYLSSGTELPRVSDPVHRQNRFSLVLTMHQDPRTNRQVTKVISRQEAQRVKHIISWYWPEETPYELTGEQTKDISAKKYIKRLFQDEDD